MNQQPTLFNDLHVDTAAIEATKRRQEAAEGESRKRDGKALAAASKEHLLGRAREIAVDIARGTLPKADGVKRADGLCSCDDVFAEWKRANDRREREGLPCVPWLGNGAGHLFQTPNWEHVGMVKSYRAHAHRNLLRLWKWKQGGAGGPEFC